MGKSGQDLISSRPQTTTSLIGGKAGINAKTKIPSHIRRK